ncbi:MAG TPA: ATP-binding protein [Candidatus Saccharimonadales bacterium]|nr:ATP-binding protein [Candidatus Saccharimonadales bacterium]
MAAKLKPTTISKMPAAAALEHERLTSLIASMGDGVIAIDDSLKVVLYNGAALNILDMNGTMTGRVLPRVLKLFDANGQPVDVHKLVTETKIPSSNRDYLLRYADGSTINLYLSIAPVRLGYGSGGDHGFVLLLRDITREKSLEEERDEFISVVSHELRTPLAITEGNIGNAQFIATRSGDIGEIRKALDAAHEQVMFLAGLVNDLSTLSRAERNVLEVEVEAINPHKLVEELAENYREQAESKGLRLKTEFDPHLETLRSSKLYVREILQNFITNAIKYTERGSVTIAAAPAGTGVKFSVSDTGIGISKSDQEKVFDKFFRSEDFRTRQTSGTGLGLYVTVKLSRLIHAEIHLESELNHGSRFSIFIPNLQ